MDDKKLENWLVNKCKITAWRDEQGRAFYEGEFITESVLTPHAPYTVVSVQFFAPKGKGPQVMRKAVQRGARTAYALFKDVNYKKWGNHMRINKTDIYHVFSNGCDEYFTPAEGGEKAAKKCFNKFKRNYGCARMYYRAKGEDEENDGGCMEAFGPFPG